MYAHTSIPPLPAPTPTAFVQPGPHVQVCAGACLPLQCGYTPRTNAAAARLTAVHDGSRNGVALPTFLAAVRDGQTSPRVSMLDWCQLAALMLAGSHHAAALLTMLQGL